MSEHQQRNDQFAALEERYSEYTVYDEDGDKIGKVDDLFVDQNDRPEYVGVKTGFLGLSGTHLFPMEIARVDDNSQSITVSAEKETVKNGPSFNDDEEITPEFEQQVYRHYGLQRAQETEGQRGGYGAYYGGDGGSGKVGPGMTMGDTEPGYFEEHPPDEEGVGHDDDSSDLEDEDELRVQRSEEELRAGTREREAGRVNVRKRVHTEHEQVRVPTRHEEVLVDRHPVNEERAGAEIGEDEVSVPVVEEEAVVEKRPVVKEEVRIRKDVVEDEEVVEEDVRKEEVEIDDETSYRDRDR